MKKIFAAFVVCALPLSGWCQLFAPGNLIFADPFYTPDGQIVEMKINADDTAEIVNVIRWDLDGATRRRALGLDVDPAGNVWVGITWTGDAESEFPEGIGQALRIDKDGTQPPLASMMSSSTATLQTKSLPSVYRWMPMETEH